MSQICCFASSILHLLFGSTSSKPNRRSKKIPKTTGSRPIQFSQFERRKRTSTSQKNLNDRTYLELSDQSCSTVNVRGGRVSLFVDSNVCSTGTLVSSVMVRPRVYLRREHEERSACKEKKRENKRERVSPKKTPKKPPRRQDGKVSTKQCCCFLARRKHLSPSQGRKLTTD